MNVIQGDQRPFCLDFEKSVNSWEAEENIGEGEGASESPSETFLLSLSDPSVEKAKQKELSDWVKNEVYTVVPDVGQSRVTARWVCLEKMDQGTNRVRTRLVAFNFCREIAVILETMEAAGAAVVAVQ